jgi:TonB-dependent receptor
MQGETLVKNSFDLVKTAIWSLVVRSGYRRGSRAVALLVLLFIFALPSLAATGVLKGKILDRSTKDPLPGAHIMVKGTSVGTAANVNGEYSIPNAPAGEQTIVVSYMGYTTRNIVVNVPDAGTVNQDVLLASTTIEGEEIVITAQAQGQLQAINQQLASNKISSVVSEARIQELPDFNAAQAISRLPGVSTLESSGEANKIVIRGLAPQYNQVAVSGISLASTGSTQIGATSQGFIPGVTSGSISQDRSVDLTMVTPYMIKSIEVYKTLTPDMNANVVGGYVNMELREAPSGFHGDALWQSGYTSKTNTYGNYRAVASGSYRFFDDDLGLYVLGNAEQYNRNADNMTGSYVPSQHIIGANGYEPVQVTSVGLNRHIESRKRYGGNVVIDYKLPSGTIRSINMFSRLKADYQDYRTTLDYQSHNMDFSYRAGINNTDLAINTLEVTNDFGLMSVELKASNSYSRNNLPKSPLYQFRQTGGVGVGSAPVNTVPENLASSVTFLGSASNILNYINLFSADYKENDQTYRGDFKVPLSVGSFLSGYFKAGGEYRYNYHTNAQSTPYARIDRTSPLQIRMVDSILARFPVRLDSAKGQFSATNFSSADEDLLGTFLNNRFGSIFWVTDPGLLNSIADYIAGNPDFSGTNNGGWFNGAYQHLPNSYKYVERYYAAYLMTELNLSEDLKVAGGARFEEDKSLYEAFNLVDGRDPRTQTFSPIATYPENHYWLPMVQGKYNPIEWFDVRYGFTQTLARPDYHQLSPHFNMDYSGLNVWSGNPKLKPGRAYNHDVMLTIHSNDVGLLSVGAFYKDIKNFTYYTQYKLHVTPQPGIDSVGSFNPRPKDGAQLYTYMNSPYKAFVKGIEADFQTRLWYLPAPFNGVVLGLNYTHIWSKARYPWRDDRTIFDPGPPRRTYVVVIDSTRTGRLINQPDDIVNAYIGYDYKGFSTRVSFVFQGNSVSYVGNFPEQDGFTRDYFRIDASARQMLPWAGLQLYLDVTNINSRMNSAAQQSIGGFTLQQNYGLVANLGIRFTL